MRNAATKPTTNKKGRRISGSIARVNADVVFGEIARPEARTPAAGAANRESDAAFRLVELLLQGGFVEIRSETGAADGDALHVDIRLAWIELDAGISGGRNNTSPIRVRSGDGGFHERRVCNGCLLYTSPS